MQARKVSNIMRWETVSCTSTALVDHICQSSIGYERASNGKYYKHHTIALKNHSEAQAICASEGGNLANLFGSNWFAAEPYRLRIINGPSSQMKIGGTDNVTKMIWTLPDGSIYNVTNAGVDWGTMQPSGNTTQNCLAYGQFQKYNCIICSANPGTYDSFLCEVVLP